MLSLTDNTEEYNNAGALLGIEGLENDELLGALKQMNPIQRQKTINKLTAPPAASKGSRAEMEKHFGELPDYIKEQLLKGDLRLGDVVIYSIKQVSSKTVKLWETSDVKKVGLNSLSAARLPKNQCLLVSGIFLVAGVSADLTTDKVIGTAFDKVESFPSIANGEFSLKANKKIIVPDTSNNVFKTSNMNNVPIGYYKLANPRIIQDDVLIECTLELGSMEGIVANTHVFVGLHGTITTP